MSASEKALMEIINELDSLTALAYLSSPTKPLHLAPF